LVIALLVAVAEQAMLVQQELVAQQARAAQVLPVP
jgi:hypothetical protein